MTLVLRPVAAADAAHLAALQVRPDQRDLVAANAKTLAEVPGELGAQVWGIWLEGEPVGLIALVDPEGVRLNGPFVVPGAAYLWRLMVAAGRQGQGIGGQALRFAFAEARAWGAGHLVTGVRDVPHGNRRFYEANGFRDLGVVEEGDRLFVRDLSVRE